MRIYANRAPSLRPYLRMCKYFIFTTPSYHNMLDPPLVFIVHLYTDDAVVGAAVVKGY